MVRYVELPAWMFDRAVCTPMRFAEAPAAALGALQALRVLLNNTLSGSCSISPTPGAMVPGALSEFQKQTRKTAMRYDRRNRPGTVEQPDLFAGPASRSPGWAPAWEALPAQARTPDRADHTPHFGSGAQPSRNGG